MQPVEFIAKWKAVELTERAAAQSHFIDLCGLVGEPTPTDADQVGTQYCFERGVTKTTGGKGWADVWKRECFAWEYKGKHKDLTAAFVQLQRYALALENPPLLVVCDFDRIRIHTNWTNSVSQIYEYTLDDLRDAKIRSTIKSLWSDVERLKPGKTRAELTEEAAAEFARLAQRLRSRGHSPEETARFINRLVFCMFAEDADLLPGQMFKRMLEHARQRPDEFMILGSDLFRAMQTGGRVGFEHVDWFNGGLFNDDSAIPLDRDDIETVLRVAQLDWSQIDTSIFGTLFERGLDPSKRSQLGAHYTDKEKIMSIIEPNIIRPWLQEWGKVKITIAALMETSGSRRRGKRNGQYSLALGTYREFINRLRAFRILDPACGSGNFLYLALQALKDIEHKVSIEAEALGIAREWPEIGPEAVKGIEINSYAAELARMTVWIGEIQWMRRNGFDVSRNPILKPLDTIECRDAIVEKGHEADWPAADVIIGNPPFLGTKRMYGVLGVDYVKTMRKLYEGRVSPFSDLVCWWFAKTGEAIERGETLRAGLVATNSIRGGKNRLVLDKITETQKVFDAWSDEPWVVEGASVRVSIISFGAAAATAGLGVRLNGQDVGQIHSDLTAANDQNLVSDLTRAARLSENRSISFVGTVKAGAFDLDGDEARALLRLPSNPNGRPNSDVVKRWINGLDIVRRPQDKWIIDFGVTMPEADAALYEQPFKIVSDRVRPARLKVRRPKYRDFWWLEAEPCGGMRSALSHLTRFIVTPAVAKHRVFAWMDARVQPDHQLIAIARDDDTTFGILHSRFHEGWALGLCTWLGVGNDPRYTPTTTFETFPFPDGLAPDRDAVFYAADPRSVAIATAARRLDAQRQNWLYPPELVRSAPEVIPGYPDRLLPINDDAAEVLRKRTLTNLYNERPVWLQNAHHDLDGAVAVAYGWPADITINDALGRLLDLNLTRAAQRRPARRPAPQRLQREPELPPMPIIGGRETVEPRVTADIPRRADLDGAESATQAARRRRRRPAI